MIHTQRIQAKCTKITVVLQLFFYSTKWQYWLSSARSQLNMFLRNCVFFPLFCPQYMFCNRHWHVIDITMKCHDALLTLQCTFLPWSPLLSQHLFAQSIVLGLHMKTVHFMHCEFTGDGKQKSVIQYHITQDIHHLESDLIVVKAVLHDQPGLTWLHS